MANANYNFFTDVEKIVTVSGLQSNIPCYFLPTNTSSIKVGSYVVQPNNGSAQTKLSFSELSQSSKDVTVKVYGQYANGEKTNEFSTTIKLKNALKGLGLSANSYLYTGESTQLNISTTNSYVYGWDESAEVSLSANLGYVTKTPGKLSGTFNAPSALNSVSSSSATITAKTNQNKYSTAEKSTNINIEIRQATTFTTTFSQGIDHYMWVGDEITAAYILSYDPYDKGVTISVQEGGVNEAIKYSYDSAYSLPIIGIKNGTSTVNFTPNTKNGNTSECSYNVHVCQQVTDIHVDKTNINVSRGDSATIKIAVSAYNSNDYEATSHIYNNRVYHTFSGTAIGSGGTPTFLTVVNSESPKTELILRNITKGGTLIIGALSGSTTTNNAAIPSGSSLTKEIFITVGTNTNSITFYSDENYEISKTDGKINAGDYFFVKVTGGSGTTGNLSCSNTDIEIETTSVSNNVGKYKVTVPSYATGSFTITFTPLGGGNVVESKSISIEAPTLMLS